MKNAALKILCAILFLSSHAIAQISTGTTQSAETPFINEPNLQAKTNIEIFPNPVEDYLQVKILNSELHDVKFEMHSIIGNVVQIETEEVSDDTYRIAVESLASGYYFLVVKDDLTRFNQAHKFLKKDF